MKGRKGGEEMRRQQRRRGKKEAGVGVHGVSFLFKERNVKAGDRLRLTLNGGKTKAGWMEGRRWTHLYLFLSMEDGHYD